MANTMKLGGKTYTVVGEGKTAISLLGPRGGEAVLVQNQRTPSHWALITNPGRNTRTVWFVRAEDGTFTKAA